MFRSSHVIWSICGVWVITCLCLGGFNYLIYGRWLPVPTVLGIAALFMLYFSLFFMGFLALLWKPSWRIKAGALCCMILAVVVYEDLTYQIIYSIYPAWGIVLYDPNVAFSRAVYSSRITSHLISAVSGALTVALIMSWIWRTQNIKQLEHQIAEMSLRFSSAHIYPHFIQSVVASSLGRSLLSSSRGTGNSLEKLAGVMRYALHVQTSNQMLVALEDEWKHLLDLVKVAHGKFGKHPIYLECEGYPEQSVQTLPMSLITLLENAIKFADLQQGGTILILAEFKETGFRFECRNTWNERSENNSKGGGFGLRNLRERIEASGLNARLDHGIDGDWYRACWYQGSYL